MKRSRKLIALWVAMIMLLSPMAVMASSVQNQLTTPRILVGTSTVTAPIINVTLPTALPIVLDPSQINGRTQIHSPDFVVINRSNTNVVVTMDFWLAAPVTQNIGAWSNQMAFVGWGHELDFGYENQFLNASHRKRAMVAVQFAVGAQPFSANNTTHSGSFDFMGNFRNIQNVHGWHFTFAGWDDHINRMGWNDSMMSPAALEMKNLMPMRHQMLEEIPGLQFNPRSNVAPAGANMLASGLWAVANAPNPQEFEFLQAHFLLEGGNYNGTAMAADVFTRSDGTANRNNMIGAFNIVGNLSPNRLAGHGGNSADMGSTWLANDIRVNVRFTIRAVSASVLNSYRHSSDQATVITHGPHMWWNYQSQQHEQVIGLFYSMGSLNAFIGPLFQNPCDRYHYFGIHPHGPHCDCGDWWDLPGRPNWSSRIPDFSYSNFNHP
jgi:hypothetical protein